MKSEKNSPLFTPWVFSVLKQYINASKLVTRLAVTQSYCIVNFRSIHYLINSNNQKKRDTYYEKIIKLPIHLSRDREIFKQFSTVETNIFGQRFGGEELQR